MKKYYMHTLDYSPAMFDGNQIVYGLRSIKTSQMAKSLYQIRKEQKLSVEWRKAQNFSDTSILKYDYLIVYVNE